MRWNVADLNALLVLRWVFLAVLANLLERERPTRSLSAKQLICTRAQQLSGKKETKAVRQR
jgi:hypothetical protein